MSVSLIDGHIDDDVMTDEQIIKALEKHIERIKNIKYGAKKMAMVDVELLKDTLDIINRKNVEIERLERHTKMYHEIRAEAVKELLDKLIDISVCKDNSDGTESLYVSIPKAREVVKEMAGETE